MKKGRPAGLAARTGKMCLTGVKTCDQHDAAKMTRERRRPPSGEQTTLLRPG